MREAIFDFLAAWTSQELATLSDLCSDANVGARRKAFLPVGVTLSDWIERRIGGEIELEKEVVKVVSDEARQVVQEKYQALLAQRQRPLGKARRSLSVALKKSLGGSRQARQGDDLRRAAG